MELDLVDAPAETVMGMQLGQMHIGQPRMRLHVGRAQPGAQAGEFGRVQAGCVELQRIAQAPVALEQVVVAQRLGLVEDFMGGVHGGFLASKKN